MTAADLDDIERTWVDARIGTHWDGCHLAAHHHGCETRLTIFTSSSGVKGFFDLRQKGSANRRSALQHWVRQHTRKVSGDDVTEVKRHLRGQTEFEWFGLTGRVHVPEEQRVLSGA